MNTRLGAWGLVGLALAVSGLVSAAHPQQSGGKLLDPFQQRVAGIGLDDQDVIDGIAMLSHSTGLAVSIEHPLGKTISGAAPRPRTLTARVGPGTVSDVLDGLCALDQTFVWQRDGNTANVLPRSLENDPGYILNRRIGELRFEGVREADDAVMKIVDQLPGKREQLAVMEVGASLSFAHPWSVTLQEVTVRQVLNSIARELGPSYGWQFSGAEDFRIITFHQGLLPNPSRSNRREPKDSQSR